MQSLELQAHDAASVFDPLGLLAPITVISKILSQQLWLVRLSWDDGLPPEIDEKYTSFKNGL